MADNRRIYILTPATGLGEVLVERLRQTGMRIEVEIIQTKT